MSSPASSAAPAGEQSPEHAGGGLKDAALRIGDVVIISMASSGPTQSIAVTLAVLLATVGYASFLPIVICFIPMLGIALGYQRLNAWQRSAGATYSWVGRALNPHAGFFAGWIMLMYYCVGTTSLTVPLGTYMLTFFSNSAANNVYAVAAVGTGFDILVLVIAALGIQLSARFSWGWAIFEYGLLVGFSIAALVGIYGHSLHHTVHISGSWFTISGAGGFSALVSGCLLAIFLYSGWDSAAYVSEEARGKQAGRAGWVSVLVLFVIYAGVILCLQGVAPNSAMQNNAANILAYVGRLIGGGGWEQVMIVAVLGGTLASLLAAIVSAGRISYAMGRDRTFPRWFANINPRFRTPWNATILFGLLNIVFLWGTTLAGSIGKALSDIVSTLGLIAAIFYLLTASTAVWYYRRTIMSSASDFFLGGFLPGLGAAFMLFVIIYTLEQGSLNGVQLGFGFGLSAVGLVLSFVSQYVGKSPYFTDPTTSHGDRVEEELAEPPFEMTSDGPGQEAGDVHIGLDLGTSGLKAVALAESGAILARASAAYPTHRPAAGAYEQDPGDWLRAMEQAIAGLGRALPVRRWRAIGLSGMLPTLVTLGPDGQPTGPAVTWQDGRADDLGDEFRERCGPAGLYRLTGQWVDGRYLLPMFARIARAEPSRAAATATIASAKDYLFAWLTGELATDPSTAAGYGCYELESGRWNAAARAQAGLPGDGPPLPAVGPMLPGDGSALLADGPTVPGQGPALPVVRPSATSRPLRAEAAARLGCPRVPVVLGAADSVLGALGLGVREPGQVAYIAGTSTVILGIADRLILDPDHRFLVTPLAVPGCWGLEMDLLATGSAITWLAGLLGGLDAAGVIELAAGTDPGRAPILLPYLTPGEQGALWDPLLRGAIAGLDLGHGREHLARALVNAIVLESRRCLAVLDETCGPGHAVEVAGGSAAAPSFRADLADAARRPVSMPRDDDTDHSARGAALVAALATDGGWPDGAFAAAGLAAEPDEARAKLWDDLWAAHEAARLRLHPPAR